MYRERERERTKTWVCVRKRARECGCVWERQSKRAIDWSSKGGRERRTKKRRQKTRSSERGSAGASNRQSEEARQMHVIFNYTKRSCTHIQAYCIYKTYTQENPLFFCIHTLILHINLCVFWKVGFKKLLSDFRFGMKGGRPFTFYSEYAELNKNIRIKDGFGVLFLCLAIPTSFCFKFVLVLIDVLPFFVTHKLKVTESCLIISPWNVFFPQHIGLFDSTRSERRDCEGTVCRL
jgi:hypothetical protein